MQPQPQTVDHSPTRMAPTQRVDETPLATSTSSTMELAPSAAMMEKQTEIQGAIIVARRFPRNEEAAFERLMRSSRRTSFAEEAEYSFPRGGATVTGPSVSLAREAARVWGNIRYGLEIVLDTSEERHIRGWAWDLETNTKVAAEDFFAKLIQRKQKGGGGAQWVKPDERDLRELTFRRGAILVRNCLLQLMPRDLIEDAREQCRTTLAKQAAQDPDAARKAVLRAFSEINVTAEQVQTYLGHPVGQSTPEEIAELRAVYQSIRDGNSTWAEYVKRDEAAAPQADQLDDLRPGVTASPTETREPGSDDEQPTAESGDLFGGKQTGRKR
jgi:hypothetical protein